MDASLDGWLTEGRFADRFRTEFGRTVGREHVALIGSGSQATLLAVAAALSHLHERPLRPGDEVITPAIGFPTTVNPLYQNGLVPVYVDVELDTFNPVARGDRGRDRPSARARSWPRTAWATPSTPRVWRSSAPSTTSC